MTNAANGFIEGAPRLHYAEWGAQHRHTVLLLHGANQHARYWDPLVTLLDDYHVVALDARGHGRSEWAASYTAEDYVSDLARSVDALLDARGGNLALVGHSTGALVSMIYAARHHGRLWAAAFVDIDPRPPDSQRERLRTAGARPPRRFASLAEVRASLERQTPGLSPELLDMLATEGFSEDHGHYVQRMDPRTLAEFPQFDNRAALPSIMVPALVVRGAQSSVSSAAAARDAAAALPRGRLAVVDGEHQLHVQQPATLVSVLAPFLAELAGGADD